MAASITKHAAPLAARQFIVFNRLMVSSPCLSAFQRDGNIHQYRQIHRKYNDDIINSKNDDGNPDSSGGGQATQGQAGGQTTGLSAPGEEQVRVFRQLPSSVVSMRQRLSEHHSLSSSRDKYTVDWYKDYRPSNTDMGHPDREHVSTKSDETISATPSATPADDFFGIWEDIDTYSKRDTTPSNDSDEGYLKTKLKVPSPTETFENILTNRNQIKLNEVETVIELPYGTMRRDQDNVIKSHGSVLAVRYDKPKRLSRKKSREVVPEQQTTENSAAPQGMTKQNVFDEQYFGYEDIEKATRIDTKNTVAQNRVGRKEETQSNYFDEQYFGYQNNNDTRRVEPITGQQDSHYIAPEETTVEGNRHEKKSERSDSDLIEDQYFNYDPEPNDGFFKSSRFATRTGDSMNELSEFVTNMSGPNERTYSTRLDSKLNQSTPIEQTPESLEQKPQNMSHSVSPVDTEWVQEVDSLSQKGSHQQHSEFTQKNPPATDSLDSSADIFDRQYFSELDKFSESKPNNTINIDAPEEPHTLFEDQYFSNSTPIESHSKGRPKVARLDNSEEFGLLNHNENLTRHSDLEQNQERNHQVKREDHQDTSNEYVGGTTKQQKRQQQRISANVENPQTAYDMAMKLRLEKQGKLQERTEEPSLAGKTKWSGALDTKGFRILKDQVLDIQKVPQDVVVRILQDSILYENEDFIAIDKPYGLPSHGGPGVHHSVGKLSQHLADRIGTKQLELIHRLDKETTGVMLLAKTNDTAWKLRNMFKERQVIKKYWVITKGVPNPKEGIIDIPIVETEVGGRYRMNVRPYKTEQTALLIRKQQLDIPRKDAVTNFKVMDANHGAALVECVPESGVKHQIRCHLAFGLNTPILGDHKYSHYSKIAPQKLPSEMLQRLGLRQPLVRYVAMHLHAKALVLPQFYNGRNVFIDCRLPRHFVQNMKWLKLRPPKGV